MTRAFVEQSGLITPGHLVKWVTNSVVADGGAYIASFPSDLSPAFTLEQFGAVGDGITDDTAAILDAFNTALSTNYGNTQIIPLISSKGTAANYKVTTALSSVLGAYYTYFDGRGCMFSTYQSSGAFFMDFTGIAGTSSGSLNGNVAAGDRLIPATGSWTVGELLTVSLNKAGFADYGATFMTLITGFAGGNISIADAIPSGMDMAVGVDTVSLGSLGPQPFLTLKNFTIDGSNLAFDAGGILIQGAYGAVLENITVQNFAFSGSTTVPGGLWLFYCYDCDVRNIRLKNTGGANASAFQNDTTKCRINNLTCDACVGQGPHIQGCYNEVDNVSISNTKYSRGGGLQSAMCNNITNWYNSNPGNVGFKVSFGASYNNITNLTLIGTGDDVSGAAGNCQNIWFTDNGESYNNFTNVVSRSANSGGSGSVTAYDIQLFSTNLYNTFTNVWVRDISHISDGSSPFGTNRFTNVNGFDLNKPVPKTLVNGANNNIVIPLAGSQILRITGPSASFNITGFVAPNPARDGQELLVVNMSGQQMTITHQATSSAANQINTLSGSDVVTGTSGGESAAKFIYDATSSKWLLTATRN